MRMDTSTASAATRRPPIRYKSIRGFFRKARPRIAYLAGAIGRARPNTRL